MKKILALISIVLIIILTIYFLVVRDNQYTSYVDGELHFEYEKMKEEQQRNRDIGFSICGLLGIHFLTVPSRWLTFGERWKYQSEVEPSDLSLFLTRIIGFILLVIGILYFMVSITL